MTLVEVLVTMSILSVVLTIFLTVLVVVQNGVDRQVHRSGSNDQARLAVEQLDRQIRSGNVLYDPSTLNDPSHDVVPYQALVVYTQTNATTLNPGNRCVQWLVNNRQQLVVRSWSVSWRTDGIVTGWRVVADHIVNRTLGTHAFELSPKAGLYGGRLVIVNIVTRESGRQGQPVSIYQSVEGRNTQYGYPANICNDIPPYPSSYPSS
jgi:type II secretory pathway pseudopilin PulG